MKEILITGGAGFIGTNLTLYIYNAYSDAKVVVLDKLTYAGNRDNLKSLDSSDRFTFIKGDIADKDFVFDLFKSHHFDLVINVAAETHVDSSIKNPELFVDTNVIGTHNLLMAAREFGNMRFHHVSTDEVFGDLGDTTGTFFDEETPYDPSSPYSASKACSDMLCKAYFRTYGLPVTISNCSNNYGPYQFPEKLIPYFFKLASEGKKLPLYGDGQNIRDWLFVEDHCSAIHTIIEKGTLGEMYCVGGNNEIKNIDIVKEILNYLDKSEDLITFVEDRKGHDRRYAIDSSKIKNELGWEPEHTFEEGIKVTLDWYKNNRDWWEGLIAEHNRTN